MHMEAPQADAADNSQTPVVPGVSNCYVFKSRLQEYAQKVGLATPVYETIKEGPSHAPWFRSTVIVNERKYYSLPRFLNRKAAEQSAAEVALIELVKSGDMKESISVPVHETGLCKNLLQEYAQKMNYALPTYTSEKQETPGRLAHFSCTVEIGGTRYVGGAARTKKEAEIKAARTALLAIQANSDGVAPTNPDGGYTVMPCKRKVPATVPTPKKISKSQKQKKHRFKNKMKHSRANANQTPIGHVGIGDGNNMFAQYQVQVGDCGQLPLYSSGFAPNDGMTYMNLNNGQVSGVQSASVPAVSVSHNTEQLTMVSMTES